MTRCACTECGSHFNRRADEGWKTRCVACWRASKATTGNEADRLRVQLSKAMTEAAILRRRVARLETQTGIPPEMLARLIRLSHPDRHQGSEAANIATAWLLAQRKEASR